MTAKNKHMLVRTSPKGPGTDFIGRCIFCKEDGFKAEAIFEDCNEAVGQDYERAMLRLITGDLDG